MSSTRQRRLVCDVPGCGCTRRRGFRLCDTCWRRLPGEYRVGIAEAHHQHRTRDWNQLRRKAGELLGINQTSRIVAENASRISPQQAFEMQARMLGERLD